MRREWEYAQLKFTCDPAVAGQPVYGWLKMPGDKKWQDLHLSETLPLVNGLGSEGWEMVGNPIAQNSVFTYQAANGTWHDRAFWVEKDFWFKREVPA